MGSASQPPRILVVVHDDGQVQSIRGLLGESMSPRLLVEHATNGWEAQRQATKGVYAALVLDYTLSDTDGETLLRRLKAIGVDAPALLLTSPGWDHLVVGADDYLPKAEGLNGTALVRAIVGMIQRYELTQELAAARDRTQRATTVLAELAHDLATPLGVVMGMTQVLLGDDNGLNADGRECLQDVAREALRACEILARVTAVDGQPSPAPAVVRPASDLDQVSAIGPGNKLVLIADDDPATRRLVCAVLASDQYSLLEAVDGEEAWRLIREHHPAVAILDWQMPIYSGLELTDVIKGDPRVRDMTVIMLTGRNTPADRAAGARAHADLYLIKPFLPQELLDAVEQALGIRR